MSVEKKDWLDRAREPNTGSWHAVGFVASLLLVVGCVAGLVIYIVRL